MVHDIYGTEGDIQLLVITYIFYHNNTNILTAKKRGLEGAQGKLMKNSFAFLCFLATLRLKLPNELPPHPLQITSRILYLLPQIAFK